ncbi:hypothetical protein GCM10010191_73020 [Actinomadura vinacea]|uniref:DUF3040 domain-containing protein n=1 Tax=Actinomadura vinacea TaxID=115336 RepID=A0ABN3K019_9ACTN
MRIPRRVDTALERHGGALALTTALVIAAAALRWQPALATFVLGAVLGGFLGHRRLSGRLRRARRENGELLRQNGALRHRNSVLTGGFAAGVPPRPVAAGTDHAGAS